MYGTSINAGFVGTPGYWPSTRRQGMVSTVLEILKLSFVETGAGHVSHIPTSETQYIVLTKSGYLISKLSFSPTIFCNKATIVPGGTTRPPFSQLGHSETPGFFTARILSTRPAHRDAWMATQGDIEYNIIERLKLRHTLDQMYLANILYVQCFQVSLQSNHNENHEAMIYLIISRNHRLHSKNGNKMETKWKQKTVSRGSLWSNLHNMMVTPTHTHKHGNHNNWQS